MNPLAPAAPGFPFLCGGCHAELPWKIPSHTCQRCGALTAEPERIRCPLCAEKDYALERVWCAFHYSDPVRQWIRALKYRREESLAIMLGRLMAAPPRGGPPDAAAPDTAAPDAAAPGSADLVVPVPLHRKRLRERGFNQSYLLAASWRAALSSLGAAAPPVEVGLLVRHRQTRPQVEMAPAEREHNVADAFSVPQTNAAAAVRGRRVLLVDDLLTSGATLNACARALLAAGADRVEALVLARA